MPATRIDGKALAKRIEDDVAGRIAALGTTPGLGVVLVGDDPASHIYVGLKEKACARVGISFEKTVLPTDATQNDVYSAIHDYNTRDDIHAILLQLPLPGRLDEDAAVRAIDPAKDADGFHPDTIARLLSGDADATPVLAASVMELIRSTGADLSGKSALVVGNSKTFYTPLEKVLMMAGMTSAFASPDEPDLEERTRAAEVLVVAVGRPHMITREMVNDGAIVIDIGITRVDGKVQGDVEPEGAAERAAFLTPVPGGVGPVTVATLLSRTIALAENAAAGS